MTVSGVAAKASKRERCLSNPCLAFRPRYANALPLETKTVAQRWKP
ncbi:MULTISPECIES: hypothetical protein [unclassified Moorena]|nr:MULTISPECIES: hypothetical protein [unclassified Moorena]NEO14912.1 hypothetical protein [Moorena sp. SIO3E8]NEQ02395.1 hypothetical protein [Moorena sp. SIO3F7]